MNRFYKVALSLPLMLLFVSCGSDQASINADSALPINGSNGHNALVNIITDPTLCAGLGGTQIQSGIDLNDDGTLDLTEVITTSNEFCGVEIKEASIMIAPVVGTCDGLNGQKIVVTRDSKTISTIMVCDDLEHDAIAEYTAEQQGPNCAFGGKRLRFGLKLKADSSEEVSVVYFCSIIK